MANEIEFETNTGLVAYAQVRNAVGQIWNTGSVAFENYLTANIANYKIAATEQGTASGIYAASMPAAVAGIYSILALVQAGGTPVETDLKVACGDIQWSGTAVIPLSSLGGGGTVNANIVQVAGDSTAPGNIALTFNGTGYVAPTAPAQQQQVANIAVTGAALNQTAASRTLTTGTETNAYTDTFTDNQVYHTITSAGGTIDIYYEFTLGSTGQAGTGMFWNGYVGGTVNSIKVYAYNWGNAAFDQIGTILGITGTTESSVELDLTNSHTGTGGNLGKVRIRFQNTGLTAATLNTDFLLVGYTTVLTPPANWSSMTIDGSGRLDLSKINGNAITLTGTLDLDDLVADIDTTETRVVLALPAFAPQAAGGLITSTAGALDLDEMNVDIEAIQTGVAAIPTSNPTVAQIATGVWEDLLAGGDFVTAGSVGVLFSSLGVKANIINWLGTAPLGLLNQYVQCDVERWNGTVVHSNPPDTIFIRYNTAQAGSASTITLDAGASATDNLYKNTIIQITGGTGAGQSAIIASYVGATKVATIVGTWAVNPDATSTFNILPFGSVTATVSGGVNVLQWNSVNVTGMPMPTYTQPTGFLAEDFGELDTDIEAIQTAVAALGSPQQVGTKYAVTLAASDVTGNLPADLQTIKTQAVTCAAGVTIEPFVGSVAAALVVDTSGRVDLVNAPNATALNAAADALLDRANAIETAITPRLALRYIGSTACGTISGAGTSTEVFAGLGVATVRVTATDDSSGNRSAIVLS